MIFDELYKSHAHVTFRYICFLYRERLKEKNGSQREDGRTTFHIQGILVIHTSIIYVFSHPQFYFSVMRSISLLSEALVDPTLHAW
jgi:hypothetical protein